MRPHLRSTLGLGGCAFSRHIALSAILASMIPLASATSASAGTIPVNRSGFEIPGCLSAEYDAAPPGVDVTFPCNGNTVSVRGVFDASGLVLGAKIEGSAPMLMATGFYDHLTVNGGVPGTRAWVRMTFDMTGSGDGLLTIQNPYRAECGPFGESIPIFFQGLAGPTTITADIPFCYGEPAATSLLQLDLLIGTGANYYDTLRLTSVEVLDENKQHLPGGAVVSDSGVVYPTGAVVVPFTSLAAAAQIKLGSSTAHDEFAVEALVRLGSSSDGADPLTEAVTLVVGTGNWIIPAGSFVRKGLNFVFQGTIGSTRLGVIIRPLQRGRFGFGAAGADATLGGTVNPVPITLIVGDDGGTTEVIAWFVRRR